MFVWFIWHVSFSFSVVPCLRVVSSVSLPSHPYHGTSAWSHCSWYSLLEGWKTFSPTWWGPQSPRSPYPISQPGEVWEGEYPSEMNGTAHTQMSLNTNIWPSSSMHLCTRHLSMCALFSLLHCPHWLFVLSSLTKPVIPVALIFSPIIKAFPFKRRRDVLHGEFSG